MSHRPSCKSNRPSAIQGTLMVHYLVHYSPSLFPIFSPTTEVQAETTYLRSFLILFSPLRLGAPSGLFPVSYGKYRVTFNMMTYKINTHSRPAYRWKTVTPSLPTPSPSLSGGLQYFIRFLRKKTQFLILCVCVWNNFWSQKCFLNVFHIFEITFL